VARQRTAHERHTEAELRLGIRFRPRTRLDNDYGTAYEVFVHRFYDVPPSILPDRVKLIVDLGANVGFACVHWLKQFPHARVVALEPHPRFAEHCRINLALNDRSGPGGAARGRRRGRPRNGTAAGCRDLVPARRRARRRIEVKILDTLSLLAPLEVDILKMDIEGSECPILGDERFGALNIHAIVMEWHRGEAPDKDGTRCRRRLEALGYRVSSIFEEETHGMIWAVRDK
jgi:FkbM family methyltransferase